ncbi:hypothetical protein phiA019_0160 [Aeromonas phage phiA019]|nr:hypothetical protein phiA009_0163 [Aeromonas phage phiA009]ULG01696.1 hypothetical protein phiA019_0160 [Aeromonas phage phiA019]
MKLQYDVSSSNNCIDLVLLNHATSDAIRYADEGNYDIINTKIVQTTASHEFVILFRMEVLLKEKS